MNHNLLEIQEPKLKKEKKDYHIKMDVISNKKEDVEIVSLIMDVEGLHLRMKKELKFMISLISLLINN